ncbi:MAG: AtpZ/AtpI family protein [Peptococcaceae bacterium]|jgi:F0F1-type ATP synthase assembly protein I|nr:AtpZ/AtpI family protein [Peptococcaceae bacterium]
MDPKKQTQQPQKSWIKALTFGSTIATSIAGLVAGGYFLGAYLDPRWGTSPWLKIILMLAGLVLGGVYLVSVLMGLIKDKEGDE